MTFEVSDIDTLCLEVVHRALPEHTPKRCDNSSCVPLGHHQRGMGIQNSCIAALGYVYRVMGGRKFREENVRKQQKIGVLTSFGH